MPSVRLYLLSLLLPCCDEKESCRYEFNSGNKTFICDNVPVMSYFAIVAIVSASCLSCHSKIKFDWHSDDLMYHK